MNVQLFWTTNMKTAYHLLCKNKKSNDSVRCTLLQSFKLVSLGIVKVLKLILKIKAQTSCSYVVVLSFHVTLSDFYKSRTTTHCITVDTGLCYTLPLKEFCPFQPATVATCLCFVRAQPHVHILLLRRKYSMQMQKMIQIHSFNT